MAISEKRLSEFEGRSPEEMARWLEIAATRYFCEARDADAFRPFELFIGTAESTATEIRLAYDRLSVSGQIDFRTALAQTLSSLEANPDLSEVWKFLIELSWLLPESEVVARLGTRFNDNFLDSLCKNDPDLFDHIFGYILNVAPHTQDAATCIRHLARSPHYDIRSSRQTLLRLCEIDPDNWTRQFALLRDSIHLLFANIRKERSLESMIAVQDELARDIFGVTGFDRFLEGLPELYFVRDGPVGIPSDNWYWRSLSERQGLIRIHHVPDTDEVALSPRTNPNERRPPPSPLLSIHTPSWSGGGVSSNGPADSSFDKERDEVDGVLGPNAIAPLEAAA